MPSIATYSPYETLAFFQSVVKYGVDTSALQDISTVLKQDEHIRNNADFDANRLSVDALQSLYHHHIDLKQTKQSPIVNGDSSTGERSPKRRKLSISAQPQDGLLPEDTQPLQNLIDQLYTRYRNEIVREIKTDEEAFAQLQDEIRKLELQVERDNRQQASTDVTPPPLVQAEGQNGATLARNDRQLTDDGQPTSHPASTTQDANKTSSSANTLPGSTSESNVLGPPRQQAKSPLTADVAIPKQLSHTQQPKGSQVNAPMHTQRQSPGTFPRQLPSPSPQRPNYGPVQAQTTFVQGQTPPGHIASVVASGQPRTQARNQPSGTQGRGSPMQYPSQHPYPPYPQYPHPQWHPHPATQQYQQHNPYAPPQYYPQPPNGIHPHTPQPMPYAPYPHTAPAPYMQQQPQWRGQPWPVHPASAMTTPISRLDSRLSFPGSGSSTPWKRKQQQPQVRPKTPPHTDREFSPLTDREESPVPAKRPQGEKARSRRKNSGEALNQRQARHQVRQPSIASSAIGPSRSQSIASRASDMPIEGYNTSRLGQKIKAEPPSTPLPVGSSDNEQRSSGRRGRPRSSTITSQADGLRTTTTKRKRGSVSPPSPNRSPQSLFVTPSSRRHNQPYDPSLIIVSKNFAKTSQLLLNGITSHKLAGIFSKPLSERDAPGYKDLILRPQDLKSVKAAISKGGRAALSAIEAVEGERDATPARASNAPFPASEAGSIGNGFYLVTKTPDLMPPKGIVNSAQLEMELVRMFANAVMFNPLPSSERGFGRSLRLRKNGGDIDFNIELEDITTLEESESRSSPGMDEDGIIADAREMFNDVVEIVGKWRELEDERMGLGTDTSVSRHGSLAVPPVLTTENGRHNSVGAGSNMGDDDTAAVESEAASTPIPSVNSGPGRKRRRIADRQ